MSGAEETLLLSRTCVILHIAHLSSSDNLTVMQGHRTCDVRSVNLLKPTGHVMHQQFNIQQLYVLPALYLCVLYLSENKQRLASLTA